MALKAYKLKFLSPLHLSTGIEDYSSLESHLHSDTIASAIFVSGLQLGLGAEACKKLLDETRFSSAFPWFENVYFMPRPFKEVRFEFKKEEVNEDRQAKTQKKINFISKDLFEKVISEEKSEIKELKKNNILQKSMLSKDTAFLNESFVWKEELQQRVTIPKYSENEQDAKPYQILKMHFSDKGGLYILVDSSEENHKTLNSLLKLLGDNGIGSDRTVGNGQFEVVSVENFQLQLPEKANSWISLGLYIPLRNEIEENFTSPKEETLTQPFDTFSSKTLRDQEENKSTWQIVKRGGWINFTENQVLTRKKSIYAFTVGSVLNFKEKPFGNIVDLRPDGIKHPVWREGRPIFIPTN